jgi:hypothetical protein
VSNVFHCFPQVQNHLSSLRGDQPQSGQRMRGVPGFFSSSSPRSGTMTGLSATGLMLAIMTSTVISWANQTNGAASAKRVLNLRDGIGCANQIIDDSLWGIGTHLHAVTDVACWFAGVSECARDFTSTS